ncbi:phosphodiester glycosidase family protein [Jeotgalibacillus malaysiensis]|uniref:phosphodiester glycosidase family protein n=1 Tax=Jeotgalibacillus malaysiensis TaxID=1508404 RepID=UPI00384FABF0
MSQKSFKNVFRPIVTVIAGLAIAGAATSGVGASSYEVTPGVQHTQSSFSMNARSQVSNILDINTSLPYISVEPGIPSPLASLSNVQTRATVMTENLYHMVGAVNGSFYHMDTGMPAYLVTQNNRVATYGVISDGMQEYMSVPSAFGINSQGKYLIDTFTYDSTISFDGKSLPITAVNKARKANESIIYTPSWSYKDTRTNEHGIEIIVRGLSGSIENGMEFGKDITGTVENVRLPGRTYSNEIPHDGYVISVHGTNVSKYTSLARGDKITLNMNVEDKWKNAQYMIGSGPLLVRNGKVDMTIDPTSWRAMQRTSRTAVVTNAAGDRVKLVTVDATSSSAGMTLPEFSQYLVSIGAYQALNLDGGGSTTMVTRKYGSAYPTLTNRPQNGSMRSVSTILGAVSKAPYTAPAHISAKISQSSVSLGGSAEMSVNYVSDSNRHNLAFKQEDIQYSVNGNIGRIEGRKFIAEKKGKGTITASYRGATQSIAVEVTDNLKTVKVVPSATVMAPGAEQTFKVNGYDQNGNAVTVDQSAVDWSVTGSGSITANGKLTAGNIGTASIKATIRGVTATLNVEVYEGARKVSSLESSGEWKSSAARAEVAISFPGNNVSVPVREGNSALKLTYDFSKGEAGTAAAYANSSTVTIDGKPSYLGMWVYGDGKSHWLRGKITDGAGQSHTINFTEDGGLNWTGWKYVRASIPTAAIAPLKVSQLYVTEPNASNQGAGVVYFDDLKAEYGQNYAEPIFRDIPNDYWARDQISYLTDRSLINGYQDGTFKPVTTLSRAHAAVLLTRMMNLPTDNITDPGFTDINKNHMYYKEIAAAANAGIISGKADGSFDAGASLSRAQMAVILTRAYGFDGMYSPEIKDAPQSFWAHKEIHALAEAGITVPYEGNYYRPNESVNRSQFSTFMYRILTMN